MTTSTSTNLKIPELKKHLKDFDHKELIEVITELYKLNGDVKDYLTLKFNGEEKTQELFDRAKKAIEDEFFPAGGHGKLRLAKAKQAITDFKKLTHDDAKTIDLMLCYVEFGTEFTTAFGDIDERFYTSMLSVYGDVISACEADESLFEQLHERLYEVVAGSDGIGWGYDDQLMIMYESLRWLDD
ncbi:hypothetical protein SAMN05216238_105181 [Lentibacillus persicus]|uniref:Uncharacterized protein n=1 Tax=Lentibacillus persicus TaxID=640948 RepID=A0A1I1W8X0_9BACI|nr:DUF6155 family protein [Lentibacillus persicus]SFD89460.1 hypothetical protein SAMN05216238_105181 [Lentibacillus persicus]